MAKQNKKLVEQSEALTDFFESLMNDVNAYQEQEESQPLQRPEVHAAEIESNKIATESIPIHDAAIEIDGTEKRQLASSLNAVPEQQIQTPAPDAKFFEVLPPVIPGSVVIEEKKSVIEAADTETHAAENVNELEKCTVNEELPEWCQHEFQAMLFNVAGLTLAVPLVDLNGVIECNLDDVAAMPGHADFYLGLLQYHDKNVPLVDTARFVLPADKLLTIVGDDPGARITRAVLIQDCQYGLACDEVNEVVTLSPEDVRWRTQRTQRRWLAGTVVEHMCALIDATAFAELLAEKTPIQAFRE